MVTEFVLNIVFSIVSGMCSLLPDVSWSVDTGAFNAFFDIIRVVGYLLPANTVYAIVALIISLTTFKIIISVIRTIWDLLPIA